MSKPILLVLLCVVTLPYIQLGRSQCNTDIDEMLKEIKRDLLSVKSDLNHLVNDTLSGRIHHMHESFLDHMVMRISKEVVKHLLPYLKGATGIDPTNEFQRLMLSYVDRVIKRTYRALLPLLGEFEPEIRNKIDINDCLGSSPTPSPMSESHPDAKLPPKDMDDLPTVLWKYSQIMVKEKDEELHEIMDHIDEDVRRVILERNNCPGANNPRLHPRRPFPDDMTEFQEPHSRPHPGPHPSFHPGPHPGSHFPRLPVPQNMDCSWRFLVFKTVASPLDTAIIECCNVYVVSIGRGSQLTLTDLKVSQTAIRLMLE